MSVTIVGYSLRETKEGKPFVSLKLQGDPDFVQSLKTGRFYLTAKTCSITSTFDEATALTLVGKQFPGRIERKDCEPFEYVVPETGELITLSHRWEYVPEGAPQPSTVPMPMHVVRNEVA